MKIMIYSIIILKKKLYIKINHIIIVKRASFLSDIVI